MLIKIFKNFNCTTYTLADDFRQKSGHTRGERAWEKKGKEEGKNVEEEDRREGDRFS